MKTFYATAILIAGCLYLFSCSNNEVGPDDTVTDSEYLILTHITEKFSENGIVSKYSYPASKLENNVLKIDEPPTLDLFADAVIYNDYLYLVRQNAGVIDKVRLSDNTLTARWQAHASVERPDYGIRLDKTIEVVNDQIVVAYRKSIEQQQSGDPVFVAYLKFFGADKLNPTDSVFVAYDYNITDFKAANNRIFISMERPGGGLESKIAVIDAQTKQHIAEIKPEHSTAQLLLTADDQLLALTVRNLVKINTGNFVPNELVTLDASTNFDASTPTAALDKKNNVLYYYSPTAQPAPTPYRLASIDLATLKITYLTGYETLLSNESPILFDNNHELIVIGTSYYDTDGAGSKLLILDKSRKVVQEALLPSTAIKILMR